MPKRLTLIAPAIVAVCVVTACVVAVSSTTKPAQAQSSCLSGPNATAPEGRHWYYRVERASGRRCWYLGEKGKRVRAMVSVPARRPDAAPVSSTPAPTSSAAAPASPASEPRASEASASARDVAMMFSRRWPNASAAVGAVRTLPVSASDSYAEETTPATAQVNDAPSTLPVHAAAEVANDASATSAVKLEHMLALLAAALAVAGIIGGLLYVASSMRQRRPARTWNFAARDARLQLQKDALLQLQQSSAASYHPTDAVRRPAQRVADREGEQRDPRQELALRLQELAIRRAAVARRHRIA
jgi:hypothetical protein